VLCSSPLDLLL